jgi:hypothetical protein
MYLLCVNERKEKEFHVFLPLSPNGCVTGSFA